MFTLLVFPEGRLLVTTPDLQSEAEVRQIMRAFERWAEGPIGKPLVIPGSEVRLVSQIAIELPEPEAVEG